MKEKLLNLFYERNNFHNRCKVADFDHLAYFFYDKEILYNE